MAVDISQIDMNQVREHYLLRERTHHELRRLFDAGDQTGYVQLALGITGERAGNYSSGEHGFGHQILAASGSAERSVFELAQALDECPTVNRVPKVIYDAGISYLKIGIGSEMAMMLRPEDCWVGNRRTIWSHLLLKHGMNRTRANQELRLYYAGDEESEMSYEVWRDLYLRVGPDLLRLGELATAEAGRQGVTPGTRQYMWPDAFSTFLFDKFAAKK